MANPVGDFDPGTVIYFKFTSTNPSTGAPFTLTGSPSLSAWKDNSVTSSTSGLTLTTDFGGITGSNHVTVDTSASASFYASGSFFDIQIAAGTVNSVTAVGSFVGEFTLKKTAAVAAIAGVQADLPIKITKNVALAAFPFFMVTSATHTTGATGLTVTAQRSLDGAALGACANAVAEVGSGYYKIDLAQTDTNANTIGFLFTATGADPLAFSVVTQPT